MRGCVEVQIFTVTLISYTKIHVRIIEVRIVTVDKLRSNDGSLI